MTTEPKPTTQPAIDLTGCRPGDRVRTLNFTAMIFEINVAMDSIYAVTEKRSLAVLHVSEILEILPDPRDEEIARLRKEVSKYQRDEGHLVTELQIAQESCDGYEKTNKELSQQLTAANANVEEHAKTIGAFEMQLESKAMRIAQLTKERDSWEEKFKEANKAYEESFSSAFNAAELEADRTAELARVLTEIFTNYASQAVGSLNTDYFLRTIKLSNRYRWNGEGFEPINKGGDETCATNQKQTFAHTADVSAVSTQTTAQVASNAAAPSNPTHAAKKDGPEQEVHPYVMQQNEDLKRRLLLQKELQKASDPLDAPVTRRELCKVFREVNGGRSRFADALERSNP